MLVELRVGEQRYRVVWEVLEGASVTEVARRFNVSRQSVHSWLTRYAAEGGLGGLGDRSSRPHGCPHQMSPVVEARIVEVRRAHPAWGADRIGYKLARDGTVPVPGRTSIYRALVRNGLIVPGQRKRRRADYRRWERARPMELWQMDENDKLIWPHCAGLIWPHPGLGVGGSFLGSCAVESVAAGAGLDDVGVEGEPVNHCSSQSWVGEGVAPFGEGGVGGAGDGGPFFPGGDDLEQQFGAAWVQGEVADLVEAEQVEAGVAAQDAGELFVVGGFGELVD